MNAAACYKKSGGGVTMFKIAHKRSLALMGLLLLFAVSVVSADYEQARNYFKSGKYVEAAAEFQTLVDNSPNWDSGYSQLGQCLLRMNKPEEAEKNFLKAIELNGDDFSYHYYLSKAYYARKQYSSAVATLRSTEDLAADPQSKLALYSMRGFSYAALEKWGDAVQDLEKARAIESSGGILSQLAKAYYSLGYNDKAVPVFRDALKASPNDASTTQLAAEALLNLGAETSNDTQKNGHYSEALKLAEKYLRMEPESYEANNLVGRAALGGKDFAKAEQAFRKVLAKKSDHCYAMVNLGKTYIAQKKWSDAESILKDAVTCAPRMAVVFESLGFVVQKQQRLPEAITYYEKAMAIKPSPSARAAIATCRQNIEIAQANAGMEEEERLQAEAEAEAKRQYEADLAKQKEWEKKRERDQ
jgi:tetratricopeptide (TPR) repeat protein